MRIALFALAVALVVLGMQERALASDADVFYADVRAGKYTQAVVYGSRYLTANPGNSGFAVDLAYAYLKLGKLENARTILRARDRYFASHPDAASIWLELSYQDSAQRAYRQAVDDADRYLRYHPDDPKAWRQRNAAVAALAPAPPDESVLFYRDTAAKDYAGAVVHGTAYLSAHPENAAFAIDLAYAYIQATDLTEAAALAQRYDAFVNSDPNGRKLLAALFYAYSGANDQTRALAYGRRYLTLDPSDDAFAMDLAYAEIRGDDLAGARAIVSAREPYLRAHPEAAKVWLDLSYREAASKNYQQAIGDVDQYLSLEPSDASARSQRVDYVNDYWGGPRATTFGYAYYEGRFDDTFFGLDQTYALRPGATLQPYLAAHFSDDLRSGPPGSPQIFNDDALVTDVGIRTPLGPYAKAFLEGGYGIGLRGQGSISDLRYGLLYSEQWGAISREYTTVDASAAFYSRYAGNTIAYYNAVHVFQAPGPVHFLLGVNGGLDSHKVYGNNYVEGLYGVELGNSTLRYRILGVEGTYLTRGTMPVRPAYSTLRAMLVLGLAK